MNIYIASNNKGKIKEIGSYFPSVNIFSESDIEEKFGIKLNIEENGKTFKDNAIIKVKTITNILKDILKEDDLVIADDSGIVIPSLPNILGVYTKRQMKSWCNEQDYKATEKDFYNYISSITPQPKTCIFEVVIATMTNNKCKTFSNTLQGTLAYKCRGNNGFGFDPIFEINGKTLAEMTDNEKSKINPRVNALRDMTNEIFKK